MVDVTKLKNKLEKANISTGVSEPDVWLSSGNYALNFCMTGNFNKGIPNRRSVVFWGLSGCFDSETEFLTPTGWKKISEWDNDLVAQYDKDNGNMSFINPTDYIKIPCEDFYHISTKRGIDMMLTPEHRVLYKKTNGELDVKSAEEIVLNHNKNTKGFRGKFLTTFNLDGSQTGINLTEDEIRLQIAIHADGSFPKKKSDTQSKYCTVHLKKDRKKKRLVELLQKTGIDYKVYEYKHGTEKGYTRYNFQAPIRSKIFDNNWYNCTTEQLNIIYDEIFFWDGYVTNKTKEFYTTEKDSADFIQYMMSALDKHSGILTRHRNQLHKISYTVYEKDNKLVGLNTTNTSIDMVKASDGYKYCFTVPSSFLVMRRNDKIFISGNSGKSFLAGNAAKQAQEKGYFIVYIDTEDAIHRGYLEKIGVDMSEEKFLAVRLSNLDEITKTMSEMFQFFSPEDKVCYIVDSLTAMGTAKDMEHFEKGEFKADMGLFSKQLKAFLRNINTKIGDRDNFFIATNHAYMNQDLKNGQGVCIPSGGQGFIFIPTIFVYLSKLKLKEDKDVVGVRITAETTKSRFTQLGRKVTLHVPYNTGIDPVDGLLEFAVNAGVVDDSTKGWYKIFDENGNETVKFRGKDFYKYYRDVLDFDDDETPVEITEDENTEG